MSLQSSMDGLLSIQEDGRLSLASLSSFRVNNVLTCTLYLAAV